MTETICACHIEADKASLVIRANAEIILCPMHAAAPELLAALERILIRAENDNALWIADEADAAINLARSKK